MFFALYREFYKVRSYHLSQVQCKTFGYHAGFQGSIGVGDYFPFFPYFLLKIFSNVIIRHGTFQLKRGNPLKLIFLSSVFFSFFTFYFSFQSSPMILMYILKVFTRPYSQYTGMECSLIIPLLTISKMIPLKTFL